MQSVTCNTVIHCMPWLDADAFIFQHPSALAASRACTYSHAFRRPHGKIIRSAVVQFCNKAGLRPLGQESVALHRPPPAPVPRPALCQGRLCRVVPHKAVACSERGMVRWRSRFAPHGPFAQRIRKDLAQNVLRVTWTRAQRLLRWVATATAARLHAKTDLRAQGSKGCG